MKIGTTKDGQSDDSLSPKTIHSGTVYGQQDVDLHSVLYHNQPVYEPKDYYKIWYLSRKGVPEKADQLEIHQDVW